MSIKLLENSNYWVLLNYLAKTLELDLFSLISNDFADLERSGLDSFQDLADLSTQSANLFEISESSTESKLLLDIKDLQPTTKDIETILQLPYSDIIIHSSTRDKFLAGFKKLWPKKIEQIKLKPLSLEENRAILDKYLETKHPQTKIPATVLTKILKGTKDYKQAMDVIDIFILAEQDLEILETNLEKSELPVFMLGFHPDKLDTQVASWYHKISPDEIQLAIALIYSKLDKLKDQNSRVNTLKQKVIDLDLQLKTSKRPSTLLWKKFLVEAKNLEV